MSSATSNSSSMISTLPRAREKPEWRALLCVSGGLCILGAEGATMSHFQTDNAYLLYIVLAKLNIVQTAGHWRRSAQWAVGSESAASTLICRREARRRLPSPLAGQG